MGHENSSRKMAGLQLVQSCDDGRKVEPRSWGLVFPEGGGDSWSLDYKGMVKMKTKGIARVKTAMIGWKLHLNLGKRRCLLGLAAELVSLK
jgi:hypothetical protein